MLNLFFYFISGTPLVSELQTAPQVSQFSTIKQGPGQKKKKCEIYRFFNSCVFPGTNNYLKNAGSLACQ